MECFWQEFSPAGKSEYDWKGPYKFDKDMASTHMPEILSSLYKQQYVIKRYPFWVKALD